MAHEFTIVCIKGDCGSEGGHIKPTLEMLDATRSRLASNDGLLTDWRVWNFGDDINQVMVLRGDLGNPEVHDLGWHGLNDAAEVARRAGLHAAGQDILTDAPSGNVRGAGPGVAEIKVRFGTKERPAESFLIFGIDKSGPGAYNWLFRKAFTDPDSCMGLMLSYMLKGFSFTIIDMEYKGAEGKDRLVVLDGSTQLGLISALLFQDCRFGIQAIHSNNYPDVQVAAISTDRLHSIGGIYRGKDDPVAIVRVQGKLPATEEVLKPFTAAPIVPGGARGGHRLSLMPMPLNSPLAGAYCQPIVTCAAFSLSPEGKLSGPGDVFIDPSWERARKKALLKSELLGEHTCSGGSMLGVEEIEYHDAFSQSMEGIESLWELRDKVPPESPVEVTA